MNQPVLLASLSKRFGGADVRVLDVTAALHPAHPVQVVTLQGSPVARKLAERALPLTPLPYRRSDPRMMPAFRRLIRQQQSQIVDCHNVQSQLWGLWAARLERVPRLISTVHSIYRVTGRNATRGLLHEQVIKLNRAWGCHFVTVSQSIVDYLRSLGIPPDRITLSYNALHQPEQRPQPAPIRQELGWRPDDFVIIVAARHEPVKGHRFLFQALHQLRDEHRHLRCLVVGDGRERPNLEAQVKALGLDDIVYFTGFRQDAVNLMAASDLFCLPSFSEGFPYALLEATTLSLPLLVTTVDGMAEHLHHGETARMVPPGDVAALKREITWCLTHPDACAEMGRRAHEFVRRRFDPAKMVADTCRVYGLPQPTPSPVTDGALA